MSTLRVSEIDLNDAGNASISISNSWNVSVSAGGAERLKVDTTGRVQAHGTLSSNTITTTSNVATFGTGVYIVGDGSVGIGVVNPATKLEVAGTGLFRSGANDFISILSDSGAIEITRASGDAYIDFKNSAAEDFDVRLQSIGTSGTFSVSTAAGERMRIDSSGAVTLTSQPAFHATSSNAPASGAEWIFNSVVFNRANRYNATTGRFTAPVAGVYYFYVYGLPAFADNSDIRIALRVNGVTYSGNRYILTKNFSSWQTIRGLSVMQLSAGDFVSPWIDQSGAAFHTDGGYNGFGGYLIG
jgi:hypothetical protein